MDQRKVAGWTMGAMAVLGLGMMAGGSMKNAAPETPSAAPAAASPAETPAQPRGTDCVLAKDNKLVVLCPTEAGFDEWGKAAITRDTDAMMAAMRAHDCFGVPKRAKCLYIDRGFTRSNVRVLEGSQEGRAGWTASEWTRE